MNRFVTAAAATACLVCAACVPASEAAPPAGAFGFVTEPSPATRGEPFVTRDGWTVRIERLALQVSVMAFPVDDRDYYRYGSSDTYRFDASKSVTVFARAVPTGPATGTMRLTGYYGYGRNSDDERTEILGLPPEVNARFGVAADARQYSGDYVSYAGPSALLVVRAENAGRVIVVDLTLALSSYYSEQEHLGREVVADALVTVPASIVAETLFMDESSRDLRFDDFAAADANGDGRVSGQELSAANLLETISSRGSGIFVLAAPGVGFPR